MTRYKGMAVIMSAVDKENRPIIGAIKFDYFGNNEGKLSANNLLILYGRNNFDSFIQRNVDENTILYFFINANY